MPPPRRPPYPGSPAVEEASLTPDTDWFLGPEWPAGPLTPSPPCRNREAEKDRQVLCLYLKCTVFQRDVGWALTPRNHYDETCHWLTRNKDTDGAGARTIYTGSTDGTTTSHSSRVQRNTHGLGGGHAGQPLPSGEWVGGASKAPGGGQGSRLGAMSGPGSSVHGAWGAEERPTMSGLGGIGGIAIKWRREDCTTSTQQNVHMRSPPSITSRDSWAPLWAFTCHSLTCDPGTPSALPSP